MAAKAARQRISESENKSAWRSGERHGIVSSMA